MTQTTINPVGRLDTNSVRGKHDELTRSIIAVFYDVYKDMGSGFLESVYREGMKIALNQAGLNTQTEVAIPVRFRGELVGVFRANLVVNGVVLIELKWCETLGSQHESQTLNYLKATDIEVALLMNFGPSARFKRFIMDNSRKRSNPASVQSVSIGVKPSPIPGAAQ